MRVVTIQSDADWQVALDTAIQTLTWGGTIVYPTDTVYGLGANALNPIAVRKIFRIKGRGNEKALPILVRNLAWAKELAHIEGRQQEILKAVWPGQVTVVLRKKDMVPDSVTGGLATVGLRVPDHLRVLQLLDRFGYPIIGTSANLSGHESIDNGAKAVEEFSHGGECPDVIIDAGELEARGPSTILDLSGEIPKILRIGAAKPQQLIELLEL